jgi:hypothetical protein
VAGAAPSAAIEAGPGPPASRAAAAEVPVGNVFYYFKTKDAIVSAVIAASGSAQAR